MEETNLPRKKSTSFLWILHARTAKKVLLFTALFLVVFLVWVVFIYGRNFFDQNVFVWIKPYITESRTRLMLLISFFGKHTFLIPSTLLLIGFFLIKKDKWMAIRTSTVLLSSLLLMSLLKKLLQRQRPPEPLVEGITNFSFPSGHAFMGVAFYGLMIWFASVYVQDKWTRRVITFLLLLIISAIGFSRVYLRVHYATDVVAGICFGFIWLDFCLWFIDKKEAATIKK